MNGFIKYLLTAAGVTVLAGAICLNQAGPALAQATKAILAEVVNTPDKPVPIAAQGTTRVEGAVAVSNTPSVNSVLIEPSQSGGHI